MKMATILKFKRKVAPLELRCTSCGSTTEAPCDCGVRFEILRPGEAAKKAIKKNPTMSNRAIAKKTGVGQETVRRARKTTDSNGSVGSKRVGLDGKSRKMPTPQPQRRLSKDDKIAAWRFNYFERTSVAISLAMSDSNWKKFKGQVIPEMIKEAENVIDAWTVMLEYMRHLSKE
jgi:hypothetical protein